jgi:hypothetical protein
MPYTRPYAAGFVDYPDTTTPMTAAVMNTMDVGIKAANDQIQTLTTAQRTTLASTATVGQIVWDSDLKELFVWINATGANAWQGLGNLIVCSSTTRPATPFDGQTIYETDTNKFLSYDGASWIAVVTVADTGTVTSTMILDGTILNADINASAGIVDTKLATIATAGKVSNSATTATSANTVSAIVARDGSGNFTAGTITATNAVLTGYLQRTAPVSTAVNLTVSATTTWVICTAAVTLTLGTATAGREITVKNTAAAAVISASSNVVPIGSTTAGTAILAATAGKFATLVGDGTNWIVMAAN